MRCAHWYLAAALVRRVGLKEARLIVLSTHDFLRQHGASAEVLRWFADQAGAMARAVKGNGEEIPAVPDMPPLKRPSIIEDVSAFEDESCGECPACRAKRAAAN